MLSVPHVLAGAALGSFVGDVPGAPMVGFAIGWASHYVLDHVPHWERLYKPFQEIDWDTHRPAKEWPRHILVQAAIDVLLAGFILYAIATNTSEASWWRTDQIFWGAVGGLVPDLLGNVPFWNRTLRKIPGFKQEYAFHSLVHVTSQIQNSVPRLTGLATQVAVIAASLWILIR